MSALHSFSPSPVESGDDHSHFFNNSDDDAETASQRSISLSSGPSSPKLDRQFDHSLRTPITSSFSQHLSSTPSISTELSNETLRVGEKEGSSTVPDPETNSITGAGASGPSSDVTSSKFDEDSTRPSSLSSGTSFFEHEEETRKHDIIAKDAEENTYPPPSQMISGAHDLNYNYGKERGTDMESLASAATGSSSGTSGRKTRPESMLVQPPDGPLVLGVALVDFNHIVSAYFHLLEWV